MFFPNVPGELLEELERLFPEQCPEPDWPERKVWMERGARTVVRLLAREHERQQQQTPKQQTLGDIACASANRRRRR